MKIKYKLWVEGCTVKFQILEQYKIDYSSEFTAKTGWHVKMYMYPEIDEGNNCIFLRGTREARDLEVIESEAGSPSEAHKLAAVIHETLEDWAKSLDDVPDEVNDVNVFVL